MPAVGYPYTHFIWRPKPLETVDMVVRLDLFANFRLLAALAFSAGSLFGLDPSTPTSDFMRSDFTVESGLPSNVVNAIAQTRNGYLWIGTDAGLASFNGRRFTPVYFRAPQPAPQGIVRSLLEGPDGALWVGTGAGLARIARPALDYFDRSLSVFFHPGAGPADEIICLRFARDGTLWVGTNDGLYRFKDGNFFACLTGLDGQSNGRVSRRSPSHHYATRVYRMGWYAYRRTSRSASAVRY